MVMEVSDATFDQEINDSKVPVLVDFWAPWCGPCRASSPHVDRIAKEMDGKLKVVKMNTDENQSVAARYGITAIPTFLVFRPGDLAQPAARKTTMMDFVALSALVKPFVG
jgi:thioredoxin 1